MRTVCLRWVGLLWVFVINSLVAEAPAKKILLMTLPKSGTHLLRKALFLITGHPTHWIGLQTTHFNPQVDLYEPHVITGAHLFPIFDCIRTQYLDRYTTILLIRDPRDVMLSFSSHLRRGLSWTSCPQFDYDAYLRLSSDEQLQEALVFPKEYLNPSICFPYVSLWTQNPSVFVCRFEDIVGSRGAGSDQKQMEVLMALAHHVGYPKTLEEIQMIAKELFGGTWTFHVGKIGRWREAYSSVSEEIFMRLYGQYLSKWNY